jgi:hypothetical protein
MDLVKVKFIKSPVGKYKMAYNAGHVGLAPKDIAAELVREGYAEYVDNTKVETKTNTEAETATNTAKKRTTRKSK